MKYTYHKILISSLLLTLVILGGCQLAGLEVQKPYKYEPGLKDNKISMNALEFIKSRPDLFSSLQEAIKYAGVEALYTQPNGTYLLLTNNALSEPSNGNAYFVKNKVVNPGYVPGVSPKTDSLIIAGSWERYPVAVVKEFLSYHVVKGSYSYENLNSTPTWFPTNGTTDTSKVNMYLAQDRNPYLYLNNWSGARIANLKPRTSNLLGTNGYIQVMDQYLEPPTRQILASYGKNN